MNMEYELWLCNCHICHGGDRFICIHNYTVCYVQLLHWIQEGLGGACLTKTKMGWNILGSLWCQISSVSSNYIYFKEKHIKETTFHQRRAGLGYVWKLLPSPTRMSYWSPGSRTALSPGTRRAMLFAVARLLTRLKQPRDFLGSMPLCCSREEWTYRCGCSQTYMRAEVMLTEEECHFSPLLTWTNNKHLPDSICFSRDGKVDRMEFPSS